MRERVEHVAMRMNEGDAVLGQLSLQTWSCVRIDHVVMRMNDGGAVFGQLSLHTWSCVIG